jgi:hypothetical protein
LCLRNGGNTEETQLREWIGMVEDEREKEWNLGRWEAESGEDEAEFVTHSQRAGNTKRLLGGFARVSVVCESTVHNARRGL